MSLITDDADRKMYEEHLKKLKNKSNVAIKPSYEEHLKKLKNKGNVAIKSPLPLVTAVKPSTSVKPADEKIDKGKVSLAGLGEGNVKQESSKNVGQTGTSTSQQPNVVSGVRYFNSSPTVKPPPQLKMKEKAVPLSSVQTNPVQSAVPLMSVPNKPVLPSLQNSDLCNKSVRQEKVSSSRLPTKSDGKTEIFSENHMNSANSKNEATVTRSQSINISKVSSKPLPKHEGLDKISSSAKATNQSTTAVSKLTDQPVKTQIHITKRAVVKVEKLFSQTSSTKSKQVCTPKLMSVDIEPSLKTSVPKLSNEVSSQIDISSNTGKSADASLQHSAAYLDHLKKLRGKRKALVPAKVLKEEAHGEKQPQSVRNASSSPFCSTPSSGSPNIVTKSPNLNSPQNSKVLKAHNLVQCKTQNQSSSACDGVIPLNVTRKVSQQPEGQITINVSNRLQKSGSVHVDETSGKSNNKPMPVASDFFDDEPKPVGKTKHFSPLKGILKRPSNSIPSETIPSKKQITDQSSNGKSCPRQEKIVPKIRPELSNIETDAISVMPSRNQADKGDILASFNIDNSIAAGLEFVRPVSGYHCVLCRTFYFDYPTALHHCAQLNHKMKVAKSNATK